MKGIVTVCLGALGCLLFAGAVGAGGPVGYEPAYVDGKTVTINAIEVPQKNPVPDQAQADFYEVVYPIGWQSLGLAPPQCNPCDHEGNGIDPTDFHDHILDSVPNNPGHGEYNPKWHVFVIVPTYSPDHSTPARDDAVSHALAQMLPAKSEAAVNALLAATVPGFGGPLVAKIDTHFYFLCAVVNAHAAH